MHRRTFTGIVDQQRIDIMQSFPRSTARITVARSLAAYLVQPGCWPAWLSFSTVRQWMEK